MPTPKDASDTSWPSEGCGLAEARARVSDRELWGEFERASARDRSYKHPIPHSLGKELRHAVAVPESQIQRHFRGYLEGGLLVAFGRPGDVTADPRHIPATVWPSLRSMNLHRSTCQEDEEGHRRFSAMRVYPVLLAPIVVDLIAERPLLQVFRRFILGDPEVDALAKTAIRNDPEAERLFRKGCCFPRGVAEWRVHSDDPTFMGHREITEWQKLVSGGGDRHPSVSRAACALTDRYMALLNLLRKGDLVAEGLPSKPNYPSTVPTAV